MAEGSLAAASVAAVAEAGNPMASVHTSPLRVLVLGASGLLGGVLVPAFRARGWETVAAERWQVDLTDQVSMDRLGLGSLGSYQWVVNLAAYTAVDKAEEEFLLARKVNGAGAWAVAEAAKNLGARLIHVSTDFVFDGEKGAPYVETDPCRPLGAYGISKRIGEEAILDNGFDAIIARTSWLYGPRGKCFPRTILNAYREGKPLRVVGDQIGTPTYTVDLARVLGDLIAVNAPAGLLHTAGPEHMTWFDLAEKAIAAYRDLHPEVPAPVLTQVTSAEFPTPARRPRDSRLDTGKLLSLGIAPMRNATESLHDFCRSINE